MTEDWKFQNLFLLMKVATFKNITWRVNWYAVSEPFPSNEGRYEDVQIELSKLKKKVSEPFPSNEGRYFKLS